MIETATAKVDCKRPHCDDDELRECDAHCELDHCDDGDCNHDDCCDHIAPDLAGIRAGVQAVFDQFGPERERKVCRWWVTMDEPWHSLAYELGIA